MKLITVPEAHLLKQIKQLQKRLNYERWHPNHSREMDVMGQVTDSIKKIKDEDWDGLSESLRSSFSIFIDPESKMKQVLASSTGANSILRLLDLIRIWDEVSNFIAKVAPLYDHEKTEIILATAAHQSFNAITFIPRNSSVHTIMFYDRLFPFIEEIACLLPASINSGKTNVALVDHFPEIAIQQIKENVQNNKLLNAYFDSIYQRYFLKKLNIKAMPWLGNLSEDSRMVAMDMEDSIRYFIIGHEIAHILCDHAIETRQKTNKFGNKQNDFWEIRCTWNEEFEADYVGLKLGLLAANGNAISEQMYMWAVTMFFTVIHLIAEHDLERKKGWKVRTKQKEKKREIHDYPLPIDRLKFIKIAITNHVEKSYTKYDPSVPQIVTDAFESWIAKQNNK